MCGVSWFECGVWVVVIFWVVKCEDGGVGVG